MPDCLVVRCLVCADLLSYDRESTEPLIAHLQEKHPYIHVAKVPISASADELISPDMNFGIPKANQFTKELKNQYQCINSLRRHSSCQISAKMCPGKVFCPACKKLEAPVIRRKKHFNGNEGIPICYMLGCWPLCFLPYFTQSNRMFDVYCRNCSFFIGRYDKKLNLMMSRPVTKPALTSGRQTPMKSVSQGTTITSSSSSSRR